MGETTCKSVSEVLINQNGVNVDDKIIINQIGLDKFAIADGFDNWLHMMEWFANTHGLPFTGDLIEWDDLEVKPTTEMIEALNDWSFRTDYRG